MTSPLHGVPQTCYICYIFANCSQTQHRPQTWVNLWKANETHIPIIYNPCANIVNFSCTSRIHFWANNTSFHPFKWMVTQMPKNARNSPFPLRHVDPNLIHQCLGPSRSPHQTTARSMYALPHNYATKTPLVTMGHPKFTPTLPLPFDDHHPI